MPCGPVAHPSRSLSYPCAQREDQLQSIFAHLRSCPPALQLDLLDLLSALLERRPSLISGCKNLLPLTIRLLTDLIHASSSPASAGSDGDLQAAIYMKLFWLVGAVGKEAITVRDLNRLFRLFQIVVERRASPLLCRLLLSALNDMANVHETKALQSTSNSVLSPTAQAAQSRMAGQPAFSFQASAPSFPPPGAFFEFQGPQPALVIPPMDRWPFPKAYTICLWLRWDHDAQQPLHTLPAYPASHHPPVAPPASFFGSRRPAGGAGPPSGSPTFAYLYSLLTSRARGIEACIDKSSRKLYLRSAGKSSQAESCTDVVIPTKTWLLLTVAHQKPKTFSRSSGQVTVMINEDVKYEGELIFPTVVQDAMVSNSIGANITNIRPHTAFTGRIGSLYLFTRWLSPQQVALLARKGSDFPMNTLVIGEKSSLFRSLVLTGVNALLNPFNVFGVEAAGKSGYETSKTSAPAVDAGMYREMFKSLLLLYHPQCVENEQMVVDSSHVYTKVKSGLNATMAAGVEACTVSNVKEVVHCMIGGVRALFPIVYYIDALSPPFSAATKGRSSASLLPLAITTMTVMLRDNPSNQKEMLDCNGLPVLAHLLRHTPPHHLNEHLLTSIEELVQYSSWLVTASRSAPADDEKDAAGGGAAADRRANDWLAGLSEGQWIPGMSNVSLPPSAAADRSLFNDLFLHVLFNLSLWSRCEYGVQADVVRLVRSHVSKQAKYFRRLLSPTVLLDRMRRTLSYEDAIQAEMIREIKSREAAAAAAEDRQRERQEREAQTVPSSSTSSPTLAPSTSFTGLPPLSALVPPAASASPPPAADNSARDSAIALRLRQLRNLRGEWLIVVKDMMLSDVSRRAVAADVSSLVQMCCDMTDSLQIAEVLELLTALSFAHPELVHPLLSRAGGATLFITILQRHSHHVHVQVAAFHLLSVMLRSLPVEVRPDVLQQLSAIFHALHELLQPHPFTLVTYQALMELLLGLAPGALGVKNGAEFSVDFNFKRCYLPAAGETPFPAGATSPAYSRSTSPRHGGGGGAVDWSSAAPSSSSASSSSVSSSFSSSSFARQCTVRFPLLLEVMFALCKKDRDDAEEKDREQEKEADMRQRAASPSPPPSSAVPPSDSLSSASPPPPDSPSLPHLPVLRRLPLSQLRPTLPLTSPALCPPCPCRSC